MAGGQFGFSTEVIPTEDATPPEFSRAAEQLAEQGFAVVRNFLGQEEMARVLSETDAYEQQVLPQLPPHTAFFSDPDDPLSVRYWDFEATHQHAPDHDISLFAAMPRHTRFAGLATACLGEPVIDDGKAPSVFNKTAGKSGETPPHQDNFYFCLQPPSCLTIWLALDPISPNTGCLRYTPYSHLPGLENGECLPHEDSFNLGFSQQLTAEGRRLAAEVGPEVVLDDLQPGDAVVHHCQTVHRAEENTAPIGSGLRRRAIGIVYHGVSAKVNEVRYQRHIESIKSQGVIEKPEVDAKL